MIPPPQGHATEPGGRASSGAPIQHRRIALCIDDFGLHAGINGAALELARLGRVTAIACMVGAPQWRAGCTALARLDAGALDIGLHLDFTEAPLATASRQPLTALLLRAYTTLLNRRRVREEIEAQLGAFEEALGRTPDFVDGHQHVHQLPVIRNELLDALARRSAARPPWLRRTTRFQGRSLGPPQTLGQRLKPHLIEALGAAALTRLAARQGLGQNAHLLGVHDFSADTARYRTLLRAWLAHAQDGDLLMCHASQPTSASDPLLPARLAEYQVLSDASLPELLSVAGVSLQAMSTILGYR